MNQHAVPRQITTFEFKLIGFMSIKQFAYAIVVTGLSVLAYFTPVPYFNLMLTAFVAGFGAMFIFYKYNDRHIDVWIRNFYFAVVRPSKYIYQKDNPIPAFLADVYLSSDPVTSAHHIDANKKLNSYMNATGQSKSSANPALHITQLILETAPDKRKVVVGSKEPQSSPPSQAAGGKKPILSGIIKNSKNDPIEGIMIYINSSAGETVRILKTNHNGVFATFHPFEKGDYTVNPKDLDATYFFDTMNITVDDSQQQQPLTIYSKEVL